MRHAISNTAEFGSFVAEERLDDAHLRATFNELLDRIRDGRFAARMMEDHATGGAWLAARRAAARSHELERTGQEVRALMPWLADEGSPVEPAP
jgi:ketol-acid reductoisomerase